MFAVLIKSLLLLVHVQPWVACPFELIVSVLVMLAASIPVVRVPATTVRVWITIALVLLNMLVWSSLELSWALIQLN